MGDILGVHPAVLRGAVRGERARIFRGGGVRERVLGFQIERVELVQTEHAVDAHLSSRGVRSDLYVKGPDKAIDVELRATEEPDLGRRMRYYQGALDAPVLSKGAKYRGLPESYIVFLCKRDPFERSIPRYIIELVCEEDDIELRADMHWLVCNAEASRDEMDPKLRNLPSFIQDGTAAQGDTFIEGIGAQADRINEDEEAMAMIFTMQDDSPTASSSSRSSPSRNM